MAARLLRIPAVFMRGGTSKGLFFHARDLPADRSDRDEIFLRALGSPDRFGRQLDGMGGGLSSLSKAVVISPPTRDDADVDYLFAQVAVGSALVDYGGTCGNLIAAVAQFAVDEGLVPVRDDSATVRIHAVNTGKIVSASLPLRDGKARHDGTMTIPGVSGSGAPIRLAFLDPDGSRTGSLLPTGHAVDVLEVLGIGDIRASLVDAANPCVFVHALDIGLTGSELPEALDGAAASRSALEAIRAVAGARMRLGASASEISEKSPSSPKVAIVAPPVDMMLLDGARLDAASMDLGVRMISMGLAHRAVPLTGALCIAAAARIPGSIVSEALNFPAEDGRDLRIGTASGVVSVAAEMDRDGEGFRTRSATAYRTARRLMEGNLIVPMET